MPTTKADLIAALAQNNTDLSTAEIRQAVQTILDYMTDALESGKRVEIRNFGSFALREWGPRFARNPNTDERWRTDRTLKVHYKMGKRLKARVHNSRKHPIDELSEALPD